MAKQPIYSSILLRLPEVESATGKKRSSIYSEIQAGTFPPPVKIGPRASAWVRAELDVWVASRVAERDKAKGVL